MTAAGPRSYNLIWQVLAVKRNKFRYNTKRHDEPIDPIYINCFRLPRDAITTRLHMIFGPLRCYLQIPTMLHLEMNRGCLTPPVSFHDEVLSPLRPRLWDCYSLDLGSIGTNETNDRQDNQYVQRPGQRPCVVQCIHRRV